MKDLKHRIQTLPWGYLVFAVLLSAAGILLCAFPEESLANAIRVIGILTLLIFIIRFVLTLGDRERSFRFAFRVIGTLFALFCGGYMLIAPESTLTYLFTIFGLYLIMAGSFKLQTAITLRRYRVPAVWVMLALSLLIVAGGFILLRFQPDTLRKSAVLLGISLIVDAAANLLSLFVVPCIEARRRNAAIDEYKEEEKEKALREEARLAALSERERKKEEKRAARAAKKAEKQAEKAAMLAGVEPDEAERHD